MVYSMHVRRDDDPAEGPINRNRHPNVAMIKHGRCVQDNFKHQHGHWRGPINTTVPSFKAIIIMDVKMPRKSGVEATQRIKQARPEVHVIGVSTQNDTILKKASMKAAGFSTFITKDCAHTLPDIIATITGRPITKDYPVEGTA
jgi:CheY-like chemotaxis protein